MTTATAGPVRIEARLDEHLSRWLWLVKWVLVIPHLIVLSLLWIAFAVLSVVAFFAILVTGRYPDAIFDFTTGVLRWTWRVVYYAYGGLGTDRYPPFTLAEVPDYPATLHIDRPPHLSRGLVLVKWLLAAPHYLVIAFFAGGSTYAATRVAGWDNGAGLIGLLVLFAGIALLFTGRYPRGVFDLVLGMHRWVLRVVAYAALMTDAYPPFRLDTGGTDAPAISLSKPRVEAAGPPRSGWGPGRIVSAVLGSVLVAGAAGMAIGAGVLMTADKAGRDADGFLATPVEHFSAPGYALALDAVDLGPADGRIHSVDPASLLGEVRIRAIGNRTPIFVGIGPADAVSGYLDGVDRDVLGQRGPDARHSRQMHGGAPLTPPTAQTFWVASRAGAGDQQLTWTAADGRWSVVVMNADGSRPVAADVSGAVSAPGLRMVWTGLFVGSGVLLVIGAVVVALALPRQRAST
jgi:hypothetical protein